MKAFEPIYIDIEEAPSLNHHLVQAYIDPDVEISECHIHAIAEAVEYAKRMLYKE